jgi:DNA excision repair protein ERCC-6
MQGLGKTVQVISFLAGLHHSEMLNGPILIVCPATVMQQWVRECHKWWPPFRVAVLHDTGTYSGSASDLIERIATDGTLALPPSMHCFCSRNTDVLCCDVCGNKGHVLITTYSGTRLNQEVLCEVDWEYAVLDEGDKIRNPDADITLACKRLRVLRLLLHDLPPSLSSA